VYDALLAAFELLERPQPARWRIVLAATEACAVGPP
jgi:hypothetical protein